MDKNIQSVNAEIDINSSIDNKISGIISKRKSTLAVALIMAGVSVAALAIAGMLTTQAKAEQVRSVHSVSVEFNGKTIETEVEKGSTVNDVLTLCGIQVDENDTVNQGLCKKVTEGMNIVYTDVTCRCNSYIEEIAYKTEYIELQTIPKGTYNVITEGKNGSKMICTETEYRNGEFYEEREIKSEITEEPVNEVIEVGVGGSFVGKDGKIYEYSYYIDMNATAYYGLGPYTKSGKFVQVGMIAVDEKVIKLGTKVYLTGDYCDYGVVSCEDTGGAIKGNKIDIYMATYEDCCDFGRRPMRVYILENQAEYAGMF